MSEPAALDELFARALEASVDERARLLEELGASQPELAVRLGDLLAAAAEPESPLDRPLRGPTLAPAAEPGAELPERIGPYRVLREIGRGGMGRVLLAVEEREAFRRTLALKVLDRPGLADDNVRRFRDEVRILAALEHPGIARFLDGGRAEDGTWFLAMEYVEGPDLLEYARRHQPSVDQRVTLLIAVLEAVGYAHARGVVHRDLKPGNILIGPDGRPRLLDFGISKLVDPEAADQAATRTELRVFTPAYASPEQFRGEPPTAATDIYSLGVVLYEVLSGRRPFATTTGGRAELERAVLELDPEPPSTAARRGVKAGPQPAVPAAAPPQRGRFGRDLDAICLKALRKKPEDRYATPAAFADDLQRYLAGHPVAARRGGQRYRLARWLRRQRGKLLAAAAAVFALLTLLFAAESRWRGEPGAAVAAAPTPRPFPFSPVSAPPLADLERRFARDPGSVEAGAELALALGRADRRREAELIVSRLRQIPDREQDPLIDYTAATLAAGGEPQRALVLFTRALDRALADGRGELVGQIRAARGRTFSVLGRREEAGIDLQLARADFEAAGDQASLARVLNDLAVEQIENGRLTAAEQLLEAALAANRKAATVGRGGTFLYNLAIVSFSRGRPDLAEPRFREVVEISRQLNRPANLALRLQALAEVLWDLGRGAEAETALDEALDIARLGTDENHRALMLLTLATIELQQGRLDHARELAQEIEAAAQDQGRKRSLVYAEIVGGQEAAARGDLAQGRAHLGEARRLALDNGDIDIGAEVALGQAEMERAAGNLEQTVLAAQAAAAPFRAGGEHRLLTAGESMLAWADARAGRRDSARRRLAAAGEGARSPSVRLRLLHLRASAELARAESRWADARRDLQSAIEAAGSGRRLADQLEARLELAAVLRLAGDLRAAQAEARAVEQEASRLGLAGIARRARYSK